MGSLYDLRRIGQRSDGANDLSPQSCSDSASAAVGEGDAVLSAAGGSSADVVADGSAPQSAEAASPLQEKEDGPLFYATLGDLSDTEASLRQTETVLAECHDPVHEYGGSRHPTAVISARTLAVVRRKAHLLQECEARLSAFLAAQSRRDDIVRKLVGDVEQSLDGLVRVNKFLQAHIHKGGNPVDANKSDFSSFVNSFGLPDKHHIVVRLHELATEAVEWWAQAALREASIGTDTSAVSRMLDLAADILGNKEHPNILACRDMLGVILAENALKNALRIQEKDAARVASSSKPQPDSAKKAQEAINVEIKTAVAMGAKPAHDALKQAKGIAILMEKAEKDRLAESVLLFAKELVAKDEAMAAKTAPRIPEVGPASAAADRIEQEVWAKIKECGVPEDHPVLKEAVIVGKALRDKDVERKRLVVREQRLAGNK